MKTKELKRIAKENEYELTKTIVHYKLKHKYCDNNITINGLCKNRLWISIPFHCDERDFNMIKAAVEFAETPPEDREEEKKFYLKHRFVTSSQSFPQKLVWHYKNKVYQLVNNGWDNICYQSQFTLKEIEEIKKRFNTDLEDFELLEVEE